MQTLYFGGDIITMEEEDTSPEAVLIKDGIIQYVGSLSQAEALLEEGAEQKDLKGLTLMPAFIDAHGHISMAAQFINFADLSECTSFSAIVKTLRQYKEQAGITENGIIMGYGYDHNFLEEEDHPDKAILDAVSVSTPVFILHTSSHMGVANSAMLRLAGIAENTRDPQGGKYKRLAGSSEPNGYIEETPALIPVLMKVFSFVHVDMEASLQKIQEEYFRYGVTTVQDGATSADGARTLIHMAEKNQFKIDVVSYIMASESPKEFLDNNPLYDRKYHKHLKFGGAKTVLDGSPQGKSAWLSKPYQGEESYCGYPTLADDVVDAQAQYCVDHGLQLLAHCNGDAASDQFISAYKKALLKSVCPNKDCLRPVMIHCQTVREDQLEDMARLSMIPSIFIGHTYFWGDVHLKNLGSERGNHISPAKTAFSKGLKVNFHQDTPVTKPDMLHSIWCAVNRLTRTGVSIGAAEKIGIFDALKAVTINSAYSYFEENTKGTLKSGKLADMIILDRNPLKVPVIEIKNINVMQTIKEGEVVFSKRNENKVTVPSANTVL